MNAERRPKGAAQVTPAKKSGSILPTGSDDSVLFAVVSTRNAYGSSTSYVVPDAIPAEARGRRDRGVQVVEQASDDQDRAVVDQAIRELGGMHGTVSANDIRGLLPNVRSALIGARFLSLAKAGKLLKTGYIPATHAAGHGRMVALWRWVG
jgi:hypothetical protein